MTVNELFSRREELSTKAEAAIQEMEALEGDARIAKENEVNDYFGQIEALDGDIGRAEQMAKIKARNEERAATQHTVVENGGDAKFRATATLSDADAVSTERVSQETRKHRADLWSRYHAGQKLAEGELVSMRQRFPEEQWFGLWVKEGDTRRVEEIRFGYTPDAASNPSLSPANPTGTGSGSGGNTVPTLVFNEVFGQMKDWGPMLSITRNIVTDGGNDINIPTRDKTSTKAVVVAEGASPGTEAKVFGTLALKAYRYLPKDVFVTNELMQDSAINVENYVIQEMSESFAYGLNEDLMVGSGSSKPQGVYTKTATITAQHTTTAANTGPTLDEILGMWNTIDPAYEARGLTIVVSPTLRQKMRQFKTTAGDYLWSSSLQANAPDMFFGASVRTTPELEFGAGKKAAVLGDFSRYIYRVARNMTAQRLLEVYASAGGIGLHVEMRAGGVTADPAAFRSLAIKS